MSKPSDPNYGGGMTRVWEGGERCWVNAGGLACQRVNPPRRWMTSNATATIST